MKQTMALLDFMASLECSMIEAVGFIDQLHELEKEGKDLNDVSDAFLSTYLREPLRRIKKMRLIEKYFEYQTRVKREANREYNVRLRVRKKSHEISHDSSHERERESASPSSPIPPLSTPERERESNNPPDTLRVSSPQGNDAPLPKRPRKRFVRPTADELREYAKSIGFVGFDPERFLDYYDARGWKVGKDSMKDWKATVRNWKRSDDERRGVRKDADPKPADEDLFAGLDEEAIKLYEQLAKDPRYYG